MPKPILIVGPIAFEVVDWIRVFDVSVGGTLEGLLARTDRSGQTAVVDSVSRVPKWLAQFDAAT